MNYEQVVQENKKTALGACEGGPRGVQSAVLIYEDPVRRLLETPPSTRASEHSSLLNYYDYYDNNYIKSYLPVKGIPGYSGGSS